MTKRSMFLSLMVVALIAAVLAISGCSSAKQESTQPEATAPSEATQPEATEPTATEPTESQQPTEEATKLNIEDIKVGKGAAAKAGDNIVVHYTLWLPDGTKLESSKDSGQPFPFVLGAGAVIPGWDQGLEGMKVGGVRKLVIPPDLAYGAQGNGPVPPNTTLTFEVEMVQNNGQ